MLFHFSRSSIQIFSTSHTHTCRWDRIGCLSLYPSVSQSVKYSTPKPVQGYIQRGGGGGGAWNSPPPPRNLEIEYGYYISYLHVTEHKYVSSKCCLEILSQIASEAIWEDVNSKISCGGMPPDPPSKHAHVSFRMLLSSCYHPVPPPPTQNPVWNPAVLLQTKTGYTNIIS